MEILFMIDFIYQNDNEQENYRTYLAILYRLCKGEDGRYSNIVRAISLSCVCGFISREQILLMGMYGDYTKRNIHNADRLLSNNAELPGGKGKRYSKYFKKIPADNASDELPLYTPTLVAVSRLAEVVQQYEKQAPFLPEHLKDPEALTEFLKKYSTFLNSRPVHATHTDLSHDIVAAAFTQCMDAPFYNCEIPVCAASGQKPQEMSYITFTGDSVSSFRPDGMLLLSRDWSDADTPAALCIYEQDTGSQREDAINGKADNYDAFFSSLAETLYMHYPSLCFYPKKHITDGLLSGNKSASRGHGTFHALTTTILFGIGSVYDSIPVQSPKNPECPDTDAPFSYREKQDIRKLVERLGYIRFLIPDFYEHTIGSKTYASEISYIAGLLSAAITASRMDLGGKEESLKDASEGTESAPSIPSRHAMTGIYESDLKLLERIMSSHPGIRTIKELEGLTARTLSVQQSYTGILKADIYLEPFLKRRQVIFRAFSDYRYEYHAGMGCRVAVIPNQLMDVYFPFLFPEETGIYDILRRMLLFSGFSFKKEIESCPFSIFGIRFPYATLNRVLSGEGYHVLYENFSLDALSQMRIRSLFDTFKDRPDREPENTILIIFFMDRDYAALKDFIGTLPRFPYFNTFPASKGTFHVIFGCMEELYAAPPFHAGISQRAQKSISPDRTAGLFKISAAGWCVYHMKPVPGEPSRRQYEVLSPQTGSFLDGHTFTDTID